MVASPVLNFDLNAYAAPRRALVEKQLEAYLQPAAAIKSVTPAAEPDLLWESMRYSVLSGGKRFRALLCLASAEALQDRQPGLQGAEIALPCACSLEMVHAMSLIHDDLPCMDNDDFRRGKPTNHKVFGEAMALLAGDALLVLASETLLRKTPKAVDPAILIDVAAELAHATGPEGMVGGQVADSIATGLVQTSCPERPATEPTMPQATAELLESIHKRKTGALLRFSAWCGARLMGADEHVLKMLAEYGDVLGLAFQIADDLLDLTGDLQTLGKTPGKDQASGKLTWVSIYGPDGSRKALMELENRGKSLLSQSGLAETAVAPLAALLDYAIQRKS